MPKKPTRSPPPRAAKEMLMGRMEICLGNICDDVTGLSEYPMDQDEVDRLREFCTKLLDLRRVMYRFCQEHDDLLQGIRSKPGREFPSAIVHARNPRKIRRTGATR